MAQDKQQPSRLLPRELSAGNVAELDWAAKVKIGSCKLYFNLILI